MVSELLTSLLSLKMLFYILPKQNLTVKYCALKGLFNDN